jgi:mannose-1-phosphate guanylyltransferase
LNAVATTWVLILAGGRGTRFWPLSRKHLPKQCLSLDGGPTLIQRTLARLIPLIPSSRVLVLTGEEMKEAVCEQLSTLLPENILVEPSGRNTAPCMIWGTLEAQKRGAETVIVLPSDHMIQDEEAFRAALLQAITLAAENRLLTLGIRPTRAETGFGWIEPEAGEGPAFKVQRFLEKPNQKRADMLFAEGKCLWNAGMFVWKPELLLEEVERWLPGAARMVELLRSGKALVDCWECSEATSIDYGVMEKSERVWTLPVEFGWSDVGSWPAVAEVLPDQGWGAGTAGELVTIRAQNNVVHAPGRLVALLGVEGLVVVDTGDVLLVARKEDAQSVKLLLEQIEQRGLTTLV